MSEGGPSADRAGGYGDLKISFRRRTLSLLIIGRVDQQCLGIVEERAVMERSSVEEGATNNCW